MDIRSPILFLSSFLTPYWHPLLEKFYRAHPLILDDPISFFFDGDFF